MVKSIADRIRDLPNNCGNLNGELERYESSRMNCSSVRKALNNLGIYSEALTQERAKLARTITGDLKEMKFGPYKNPIPDKEQLLAVVSSRDEHFSMTIKLRNYILQNTDLTQKANGKNTGAIFHAKTGELHNILNKYLDAIVDSQEALNAFIDKQPQETRESMEIIASSRNSVRRISTGLDQLKNDDTLFRVIV